MKIEDRIILKTIDGKVVVRPHLNRDNAWFDYNNISYHLNEEGVEAWNNGEDIHPYHFDIIGNMTNLSKIAQAEF
jgi:hypothetical protein